jgi:hypothetical protein
MRERKRAASEAIKVRYPVHVAERLGDDVTPK